MRKVSTLTNRLTQWPIGLRGHVSARALGISAWFGGLAACTEPSLDATEVSFQPTGVIEGTVVYAGRRPDCTRSEDGAVREVSGRVLLQLVDDTNPLPPEGTAERPVDLFSIGGEDLFPDLRDCLPASPTEAQLAETIERRVSFSWRAIPLATSSAGQVSYRISAMYDQEGDFNPLFAVEQTATAGDLVGAAVVDPRALAPEPRLVTFQRAEERPLGQVVSGVTVAISRPVLTEAPLFRLAPGAGVISAETPVPTLIFDAASVENALGAGSLPRVTLSLYPRDDADPLRRVLDETLTPLRLGELVRFDDALAYAWYLKPIDADGDGQDDPHPIFGRLGIPWRTPLVFLQRLRNQAEIEGGVPSVAFVPFVRSNDTLATDVRYPDLELGVPPLASLQLNPQVPACSVPFFAPGSWADLVVGAAEGGAPLECQEFPTGFYGVNVLHGLVQTDATVVATDAAATSSDTGFDIAGTQFGAQVWRIPNELGSSSQVAAGLVVAAQGTTGAVLVYDPDPSNVGGRAENPQVEACRTGPGLAGANTEYTYARFPRASEAPAGSVATFETCCGPILHLCDVPLCEYGEVRADHDERTRAVRAQPTRTSVDTDDGKVEPNCLAFPMPSTCCASR